MGVITCPCPNPYAGLANFWKVKKQADSVQQVGSDHHQISHILLQYNNTGQIWHIFGILGQHGQRIMWPKPYH